MCCNKMIGQTVPAYSWVGTGRHRHRLGAGSFAIPYDKRTLALYLGMTPERLSRNLSLLAPQGLVVRGRRVTLNNRRALAAKTRLSLAQFT